MRISTIDGADVVSHIHHPLAAYIDEVKVSTVLPEVIRIMSILPFQAGRLEPRRSSSRSTPAI
jgi:hypothetical protein